MIGLLSFTFMVFIRNCHPESKLKINAEVILDNTGREVARFNRPFKLTCRCCTSYVPCCLQEMEITASGTTIGWILQKADLCNPVYQVCDADKQVVLQIKGPVCAISCCGDIDFEVRHFFSFYHFFT